MIIQATEQTIAVILTPPEARALLDCINNVEGEVVSELYERLDDFVYGDVEGGAMTDLTPKPGHVVEMESLPTCDLCGQHPATWDCPSRQGPWGYMCERCEPLHHTAPGRTGVGIGQRLVVQEEASHGR